MVLKKFCLDLNSLYSVEISEKLLNETRNSYLCVTPKNHQLMFVRWIKKHCQEKVIVCFILGKENF